MAANSRRARDQRTRTKPRRPRRRRPPLTAATADRHDLYQRSVQNVEHEIDFVDRVFFKVRGRRAATLREDFCGTANTACEWVRRRTTNTALGLDLDPKPLAWGTKHNLSKLTDGQRSRLQLVKGNVLTPPPGGRRRGAGSVSSSLPSQHDIVLAMNFSYWTFKTREMLLQYFTAVRRSLSRDGLFFMDFFGGSDVLRELTEQTRYGGRDTGFTYLWEQERYDPITGDLTCHIHFRFPNRSVLRRAFTYHWRLWTMPEIRDVLRDAGFGAVHFYTEGDDGKGGGNGVFREARHAEADRTFIAYIVAER